MILKNILRFPRQLPGLIITTTDVKKNVKYPKKWNCELKIILKKKKNYKISVRWLQARLFLSANTYFKTQTHTKIYMQMEIILNEFNIYELLQPIKVKIIIGIYLHEPISYLKWPIIAPTL